jgi:hypothetical protein
MKNKLFVEMLGIGIVAGLIFSRLSSHFAIWQITLLTGIITAVGINALLRQQTKSHH